MRDYGESLVPDPDRLQAVRERIGTLKQLQRKYGSTDADVLLFLAEASARLATLVGADDRIGALDAEVETMAGHAADRAATVTAGRRAAAGSLRDAVRAELEELGMPGATFEVRLEALEEDLGITGAERVELWFSPDPRQPVDPSPRPRRAGSSPAMLACRSVLADLDDVGTLVFDEIDAGIGGHAGLAVGRGSPVSPPAVRCSS